MRQQALAGFEQPNNMHAMERVARSRIEYEPRLGFFASLKESATRLLRSIANKALPSYELRRLTRNELALYESQQKIEDPVIFSNWLKVAAGWCTWAPGPNGGIVPIANPNGYHGCTDEELSEFLFKRKAFVGSKHARKFLWSHLSEDEQSTLLYQIFPKE